MMKYLKLFEESHFPHERKVTLLDKLKSNRALLAMYIKAKWAPGGDLADRIAREFVSTDMTVRELCQRLLDSRFPSHTEKRLAKLGLWTPPSMPEDFNSPYHPKMVWIIDPNTNKGRGVPRDEVTLDDIESDLTNNSRDWEVREGAQGLNLDRDRSTLDEAVLPHEIKSERYWRQILAGNDYALKVLDTVMLKQGGRASDRQMQIMRRVERGDRGPYSTKNESHAK